MKKLLSTLAIGILLLTGCSNSDVNTEENEGVDKAPVVEETDKPAKEPVEEDKNQDVEDENIDKNDESKEDINNEDTNTDNEVEGEAFTEEMLIEKAIETLYYKTGESTEDVSFVQNQDESYVKENDIKEQYYIFNIVENKSTEYEIIRDYNILVDVDTYEVYVYLPEAGLEHYSEFIK